MPSRLFAPGFRFSAFDATILIGGAIGAVAAGAQSPFAGAVIAMAVGHFFLFCNVFRIPRWLELVWAGVFVILNASTQIWGIPGWTLTVIATLCGTAGVIAVAMRHPSYHGVFWKRVNPSLPQWWDRQ